MVKTLHIMVRLTDLTLESDVSFGTHTRKEEVSNIATIMSITNTRRRRDSAVKRKSVTTVNKKGGFLNHCSMSIISMIMSYKQLTPRSIPLSGGVSPCLGSTSSRITARRALPVLTSTAPATSSLGLIPGNLLTFSTV